MQTVDDEFLGPRANELYERKLRADLEQHHHGEFVAIEPDSGAYFLGRTLDEAINAAKAALPDRLTYVMRVGFLAAIEIGNYR